MSFSAHSVILKRMAAKQRNKLFDFTQAQGPSDEPHVGEFTRSPASANKDKKTIGVSELVERIRGALTAAMPGRLAVVGEISNLSRPASGHLYFNLKDESASIGACMWKSSAGKLKFSPADGMEVVVTGKVDVYGPQGKLQLYVESISPRGEGALELAFRQLKEKLSAAGLFDPTHKRTIPQFPRAVGVITSATGAAVRDIQRTIRRRWPGMNVYLLPATVQGEGAAAQLATAVTALDSAADKFDIDVIIIGRGGGSMEDLWPFNEEILARAIFAAHTPIISGVGHEVDFTICDMVADLRAATPTAAAEHAVPDREEIVRHVGQLQSAMTRSTSQRIRAARLAVDGIARSVFFRDPLYSVKARTQRMDELSARLASAQQGLLSRANKRLEPMSHRLAALHPSRLCERAKAKLDNVFSRLRWVLGAHSKHAGDRLAEIASRLTAARPQIKLAMARQHVTSLERQLAAMSYRNVLMRGFSVTRGQDGNILRSTSAVTAGMRIETEFFDGKISSTTDGDTVSPVKSAGNSQPSSKAPRKTPAKKRQSPTTDQPGLFD